MDAMVDDGRGGGNDDGGEKEGKEEEEEEEGGESETGLNRLFGDASVNSSGGRTR